MKVMPENSELLDLDKSYGWGTEGWRAGPVQRVSPRCTAQLGSFPWRARPPPLAAFLLWFCSLLICTAFLKTLKNECQKVRFVIQCILYKPIKESEGRKTAALTFFVIKWKQKNWYWGDWNNHLGSRLRKVTLVFLCFEVFASLRHYYLCK